VFGHGSRKQIANNTVYQRTTAAAEVERSWSSIRRLVYVANADETNEERQTHQFLKGGITHVTWAVRGLTRINAEPAPLGHCLSFKMTRLRGERKVEATGHCCLLK
jgi:hypothetical protein